MATAAIRMKDSLLSSSSSSPETDVTQMITPSNIDNVLIQELNELSLNDREKTMEEIHGAHAQTVAQHEQPDKIQESLRQMRLEVQNTPPINKQAFEIAIAKDPRYVDHDKFWIRFLRAEEYDPRKAANRMMSFLEFNREFFGEHVLTRPVCQRDLSPAAIRTMTEEGMFQILPFRDNSGRRIAVFLGVGEVGMSFPDIEKQRTSMYIYQCLSNDEQTQRLGFVLIVVMHTQGPWLIVQPNAEAMRKTFVTFFEKVPVRSSAIHVCFPDTPVCHALKSSLLFLMSKKDRSRTRFHLGSPTECRYSLKSFGIPGECVPFSVGPNARDEMKSHQQWCQLQQSKEELLYKDTDDPSRSCFEMESFVVECPQNEDCLFGKGRAIMKHPGTLAMHNILKNRMDCWNNASFKEKNGLTWEVVNEILSGDGRFLRQDPCHGWFVPVEDEVARQKVSIAFRDMAKRIRKRSQRQQEMKTAQEKIIHSVASKSSRKSQIPALRDPEQLLSNSCRAYSTSDSEASDGGMCSFLFDRTKVSSNRKGQNGFENRG
ncbi:hypothetical protein IV203_019934 [Nitzschia inconspicua]|uniref:DUF6824 domain-containing protein n=1 Tax=Nitzschia inconspicua TaxID=303405 RepID=A0A9K3M067_9STRA|nr:hypothetical protein IV203_019934 [Nitzschia inconspicua]